MIIMMFRMFIFMMIRMFIFMMIMRYWYWYWCSYGSLMWFKLIMRTNTIFPSTFQKLTKTIFTIRTLLYRRRIRITLHLYSRMFVFMMIRMIIFMMIRMFIFMMIRMFIFMMIMRTNTIFFSTFQMLTKTIITIRTLLYRR